MNVDTNEDYICAKGNRDTVDRLLVCFSHTAMKWDVMAPRNQLNGREYPVFINH